MWTKIANAAVVSLTCQSWRPFRRPVDALGSLEARPSANASCRLPSPSRKARPSRDPTAKVFGTLHVSADHRAFAITSLPFREITGQAEQEHWTGWFTSSPLFSNGSSGPRAGATLNLTA